MTIETFSRNNYFFLLFVNYNKKFVLAFIKVKLTLIKF